MRVEDVFTRGRQLWVRLHEMPCHHNLEAYLHAYVDGCGLALDLKGPLFRRLVGAPAS